MTKVLISRALLGTRGCVIVVTIMQMGGYESL